ncbi:MAG TPA: hypothetical protein PLW68_00870 [Casimicrobiaceae bacterium]|nr:hypothetical protein [Casimicrobiaceae bacterium]
MRLRIALVLIALLAGAPALADYDAALEAKEQAQRDAAKRAAQEQQRKTDKIRADAQAKANQEMMADKRKRLGAAANGKSDAEVSAMYDAKVKSDTAAANAAARDAQAKMNSPEGNAQMKGVTGKSMKEIQNMSPAELDALSKEMEKKYGK